jgi:hypothetical protein
MKKTTGIFIFLFFTLTGRAQDVSIDTIKSQLYQVNQVFDKSYFLQFNVTYIYQTDTVLGRFDHSEKTGNYTVNGEKFYYKLDNIEYMQNDSISCTVFHGDKIMILEKRKVPTSSKLFPLKEMIDSVITDYSGYYHISMRRGEDSSGEMIIDFSADSANAFYSSFSITYDADTKHLHRMEFNYTEMEALSQATSDNDSIPNYVEEKIVPRKKKMTLIFSDYHLADVDFNLFSQDNYVLFDYLKKIYEPIDKYRGYQLYVNGIEQGDFDITENPEVIDNPEEKK